MDTRRAGWAALALGALALAGCASEGAGPGDAGSAAPPSAAEADLGAGWLDGGRGMGLVTFGSSTCVPTAADATYDDGTLTVELVDRDGAACTADYGPRATYVAMPEGVDPTRELEVVVFGAYAGSTDIDGAAQPEVEEYTPSAGWAGDDMIVVGTWGSSSCPPVVSDVSPAVDNGVTVTFATPPSDQVCTADMAARATLIHAEGLDDDMPMSVTLTGGPWSDAPVTLPVVA
jgi:hypothetical protein